MGSSLVFMLVYLWSRNFPTGNVSLMGVVTIQAFYMPFALLGLSFIMGGNWLSDLLGIFAGHL
jgi:Derlin-2/3